MARQKKKDVALTPFGLPADYAEFLESLKSRVQQAQTKAMLSVNRELIRLYWDIGRLIFERQEEAGGRGYWNVWRMTCKGPCLVLGASPEATSSE